MHRLWRNLHPVYLEYVQTFFNTTQSAQSPTNQPTLTTLLRGDPVDSIITIPLCPNPPTDSNRRSLPLYSLSIGVNICDSELDGSVILGGDQSV
jgi:hypothetical protein